MGGYASACIKILIGWIASFAEQIWSIFTNQAGKSNNLISWAGDHWKAIVVILCIFGALADLAVYLFRWEPIKVWKSYFRRKRKKNRITWPAEDEAPSYDQPYDEQYDQADAPYDDSYDEGYGAPPARVPYFASNRPQAVPGVPDSGMADEYGAEEHTARYPVRPAEMPADEPPRYSAPNMPAPPEYRALYQRPEARSSEPEGSMTEKNLEKVIGPRRRKFRVNELFSDSEENPVHFEAPKPVIDKNEAYHAPVYPSNWKDSGEDFS